jgi:histidinol-phosphate aminotransferase
MMNEGPRSKRAARLPDPSFLEAPDDFIRLDLSISKYSPAPNVKEALQNALEQINEYPSSNWYRLREKLAALNSINSENVLLANGLDEGIDIVTRTFVDPGAKVVIPTPTFSQFEIAALRQDAVPVELYFLTQSNYQFNETQVIETVQRENVQLVWICNPNNPTGIVERNKIIEVLENVKCLVAVDECYHEFYGETIMDLVPDFENLLVLRSFSKTYGLAGLRIGFLAGNADLISLVHKMRQPLGVNLLAQIAALAVLENREYYEQHWRVIKRERKTLCTQLAKLGLEILPSETNSLLIRTPQAKSLFQSLWDNKILVFRGWDAAEFSGLGENFLRITVGSPEENAFLLKTLQKILA